MRKKQITAIFFGRTGENTKTRPILLLRKRSTSISSLTWFAGTFWSLRCLVMGCNVSRLIIDRRRHTSHFFADSFLHSRDRPLADQRTCVAHWGIFSLPVA